MKRWRVIDTGLPYWVSIEGPNGFVADIERKNEKEARKLVRCINKYEKEEQKEEK